MKIEIYNIEIYSLRSLEECNRQKDSVKSKIEFTIIMRYFFIGTFRRVSEMKKTVDRVSIMELV